MITNNTDKPKSPQVNGLRGAIRAIPVTHRNGQLKTTFRVKLLTAVSLEQVLSKVE